ncbi:MAG: PAS domain-containing protein [Nitrosomonas sp.]|nr:PAS domain-containing protein [Nitrosomonas sp.]MDP1951033.1 PAS domain-containing protein [Nitrosomonas sp.]
MPSDDEIKTKLTEKSATRSAETQSNSAANGALSSLQNSVSGLRMILDQAETYIYIKDTRGCYTYVNQRVQDLFGTSLENIIGRDSSAFFDLELLNELMPSDCRVIEQGEMMAREERAMIRSTGETRIYWVVKRPLRSDHGQIIGMCEVSTDITERKRADEKLQHNNDRLSLAIRAAGVGIWDWDIVQDTLICDDQMFALYGITRDQFSDAYNAWREGVHPEDLEKANQEIQMALRGEKDFDTEFRIRWTDGTIRNIRALASVTRDASGQPLRMIGTNWDITRLKQEDEFTLLAATIYQSSSEAIMVTNENNLITAINPAFT